MSKVRRERWLDRMRSQSSAAGRASAVGRKGNRAWGQAMAERRWSKVRLAKAQTRKLRFN